MNNAIFYRCILNRFQIKIPQMLSIYYGAECTSLAVTGADSDVTISVDQIFSRMHIYRTFVPRVSLPKTWCGLVRRADGLQKFSMGGPKLGTNGKLPWYRYHIIKTADITYFWHSCRCARNDCDHRWYTVKNIEIWWSLVIWRPYENPSLKYKLPRRQIYKQVDNITLLFLNSMACVR
jgi:hypothetical protein